MLRIEAPGVASRHHQLPAVARRSLLVGVLAAHVALAWGLLQLAPVREALGEVAPLWVELVAAPTQPALLPPPRPAPKPAPTPPPPTPLVTSTPAPAPSAEAFVAPEPAAQPTPAAAASVAPAMPLPAPKTIPATAVQYLEPPAPVYPPLSRRLAESGRVLVRVEIDTEGRVRQEQLLRSSGHKRLDESALAAVRAARFKPCTENGAAQIVWTIVPIVFELEH